MTHLLPILETLRDCDSHDERRLWLNAVPYALLLRDFTDIRALLQEAGFGPGLVCLEAEYALLHSRRSQDGGFLFLPLNSAHLARTDMAIAARRGQTKGLDQ